VPVDYQDYANEAEEWADMIADNRIAKLAETNDDELKKLLGELDGQIDLDLTGFDEDSLEDLLGEAGETSEDGSTVPAPPVDPITKLGDLYELGEHRLLCGDSTHAEDVQRLMNGERAGLQKGSALGSFFEPDLLSSMHD
jgi:hypothetical protein